MASELETFSPREVETIKAILAPGVSNDELALFAKVCSHLDLSPFRDEVALVGRYSREAGRKVYKHQVTVHGRRVLAARTGQLRGIDGPYWCGPKNEDGTYTWADVWLEDEPPHAARVFVYREGWSKPANGTVPWREFAQRKQDGTLSGLWPSMPAHMLGKVAEALGLRRAFPEVITAAVAGEYDEYDLEPAAGGAAVEEDASRSLPPRPAGETTTAMMTRDQAEAIGSYLAVLGLSEREPVRTYITEHLGREVEDTRTITEAEAVALIFRLRADVDALTEPEGSPLPDDTEAPE